ncbi:MAG TPA: hypothetical protein VJV04_03625 [Nitrospiraceae bacterium]|nr:hypothetical protein [Nitrospiraceae bacterium]
MRARVAEGAVQQPAQWPNGTLGWSALCARVMVFEILVQGYFLALGTEEFCGPGLWDGGSNDGKQPTVSKLSIATIWSRRSRMPEHTPRFPYIWSEYRAVLH